MRFPNDMIPSPEVIKEDFEMVFTDVCIVGAGIGGCALKRFLNLNYQLTNSQSSKNLKQNFSSLLFEKDPFFSFRKQGYGLTMQQGSKALRTLKLEEVTRQLDTPNDVHYHFKPSGELTSAFGRSIHGEVETNMLQRKKVSENYKMTTHLKNSRYKKRQNLHLPREKLRELLIEDLVDDVRWGHEFIGFMENSNKNFVDCRDYKLVVEMFRKSCNSNSPSTSNNSNVSLRKVFVCCNLLVGSDGIFSNVRRALMQKNSELMERKRQRMKSMMASKALPLAEGVDNTAWIEFEENDECDALRYLGIVVVLGWCPNGDHSLYRRTTFQTCDFNRNTRLFTMPFTETELFWQISFPVENRARAEGYRKMRPEQLRKILLERVKGWHAPVEEIFQNTNIDNMSCTPVYDRGISYPFVGAMEEKLEGALVENSFKANHCSTSSDYVTLIGDAAHPMSPFKGQGANQALLDAVALGEILLAENFLPSIENVRLKKVANAKNPAAKSKQEKPEGPGVYLGKKARKKLEKAVAVGEEIVDNEMKEERSQNYKKVYSSGEKVPVQVMSAENGQEALLENKIVDGDPGSSHSSRPFCKAFVEALRRFEREMFDRAEPKVEESARVAVALHFEQGVNPKDRGISKAIQDRFKQENCGSWDQEELAEKVRAIIKDTRFDG